ncbi:hypothetical protein BDV06DRAFT_227031 [Aspergillus oleicola]
MEKHEHGPSHYVSDTDTEACNTPTQTACTGQKMLEMFNSMQVQTQPTTFPGAITCPHNGATFVIRDCETGSVLGMNDGVLQIHHPNMANDTSIPWRCIENNELSPGFKNVASGRYLGHNNLSVWRLIAKVEEHKEWEWFCVRPHLSGGNVHLVKRHSGLRVVNISGEEENELVVLRDGIS